MKLLNWCMAVCMFINYILHDMNGNMKALFIGQDLGQSHLFREQFDVAVARAVAEMRVLGNHKILLFSFFSLYFFTYKT